MKKNVFDFYYNPSLNETAYNLFKRLKKKYPRYEIGRNRLVLFSKFAVIKVPLNDDGLCDNDWEGSIVGGKAYKQSNINEICYPNTKYLVLDGLICVMMEKVIVSNEGYDELPDWVKFIDCGQVGYDRSGRLVAYDYGYR
jgi:hypothetical protein